jgi:hypothetical protein
VAGVDPTEALALAAELEQRDSEQAAALDALGSLADRVEAVRSRARELRDVLEGLPIELTRLEAAETEVRERDTAARAELDDAEARFRRLSGRPEDDPGRDDARRAVERARSTVGAAEAAVMTVQTQRERLLQEERSAHDETGRLEARAGELAHELRDAPLVSEAGGVDLEPGLDGVLVWADRAHAALLVARTNVERDRDRTVREAAELASSALGEPGLIASVASVRQRLERELGG